MIRSNCCGSLPVGEVDRNNLGFCGECKEHAYFPTREERAADGIRDEMRMILSEVAQTYDEIRLHALAASINSGDTAMAGELISELVNNEALSMVDGGLL